MEHAKHANQDGNAKTQTPQDTRTQTATGPQKSNAPKGAQPAHATYASRKPARKWGGSAEQAQNQTAKQQSTAETAQQEHAKTTNAPTPMPRPSPTT